MKIHKSYSLLSLEIRDDTAFKRKGIIYGHKDSFPMKTMIIKAENALEATQRRLVMGKKNKQITRALKKGIIPELKKKNIKNDEKLMKR